MLDSIIGFFSPIKAYIIGAVMLVISITIGVFKYRGKKIDSLENDITNKDVEIATIKKVTETEADVKAFEADARVAAAKAEAKVDSTPIDKFYNI